jgi:tetratricopeptide (TPR) repeat protein
MTYKTDKATNWVEHAQQEYIAKNYGSAAEYFEKALTLDANNIPALVGYAKSLVSQGNHTDAAVAWKQLIDQDPDCYEANIGRAEALLAIERFEEAEKLCLNVIRKWSDQARPSVLYARIAMGQQRWKEAAERWDKVVEKFPNKINGHIGKAYALLRQDRFIAAEPIFVHIKRKWPKNPAGYIGLARVSMKSRDWDSALERWKNAIDLFPDNTEVRIGYGNAHLEKGFFTEARSIYQNADHSDESLDGKIGLARIAMRKRDWLAAAKIWESILNLQPKNTDAMTGCINALLNTGQIVEAEKVLSAFLAHRPADPRAHFSRARVAHAKAQLTLASDLWNKCISGFPEFIEPYLGLADTLCEMKRLDEASEVVIAALGKWPSNVAALQMQLKIKMDSNLWADVRQICESILSKDPGNLTAKMHFGRSLLKLGLLDEADKQISEVLDKDKTRWGAYFTLSNILEQKRRLKNKAWE